VLITTLAVLAVALLTSVLDARLEARTAELARSLTLANQELTQLALHDTLTGLPNRTLLADRIEQAMGRVAEQGGCFALMFIDLDGFKPVNDAFGHHIGDLLLKAVAARLRGHLHSQDTLARIGGDEFVLLVELASRTMPWTWRSSRSTWWPSHSAWPSMTCNCRPAWASSCTQATARTSMSCCAMPTRRCTTPRAPARTATASSTCR
jgi:GGDEF domain-containing protein